MTRRKRGAETDQGWSWDQSDARWVVAKCIPDPALDLNPRVLCNLLKNEEHYLSVNYFKNQTQTDVKPFMRRMVTTWMLEVCEEQRCESAVFALACNLLDRFLSGLKNRYPETMADLSELNKVNKFTRAIQEYQFCYMCRISRSELQLLGAACLLVASKARETMTLSSGKLVIYTDNSITADQLLDMELLLLLKLKWDIMVPTTKDFLAELLNQAEKKKMFSKEHREGIKNHANTFIDLITLDEEFLITPPSAIAACCVLSAILGKEEWGSPDNKDYMLQTLMTLISSDHDYFSSIYQSIHASLERTMSKNGEDEIEEVDTSQEIESSTTPPDVDSYDYNDDTEEEEDDKEEKNGDKIEEK